MKFICFGYLDTKWWGTLSPKEQNGLVDDCLAYDAVLKKNGHWAGGEGLQPNSTTLRYKQGKTIVTEEPYAKTEDFLGGLLFLEAKDLNEAVQLISNHPGLKMGPWEIRPAADLTPMIRESEKRRGIKTS